MTRVAHIQPNEATGGKPPVTGYIHHSQILQRSLIGVPCSVFSSRTHHSDPEPNWYIYHSDHLGSSAFLTDALGDPTQHLQYMPFGETFVEQRSITSYYTPYTFSAKERDLETGYSYFGARYYDADISVFISVDRFADKYPDFSPYHYCLNNPVNFIDINGDSTFVTKNQNGTYSVYGGNLAGNDNGIYCKNSSGKYELIGYSATPQSFYNAEEGKWMGTIDPKNQDGKNFLNNLQKNRPGLLHYILNATGGKKFDFKRTNGTSSVVFSETKDHYRGMPLDLEGEDPSKPVYASARDVGNIGAGLIAGWNGFSWSASRLAFDAQHSRQKGRIEIESMSTQYAQRLGWRIGNQIYQKTELSRIPGNGHLRHIKISKSIIKRNFGSI
jgi:RHS repeat-associated protein